MANLHARAKADDDTAPGTTIRFFLSSTFADFQVERTVLQEQVFPQLRMLCAQSGFRLQPIDLRWGVSEEAGTERQTLQICFDELERCRRLSPDFFLLILLGNRYGSHFLPPELPVALVERLLTQVTLAERRSFEATYRLDENAVPPAYVLVRAEGPQRAEDEELRLALVRSGQAAGLSEVERSPFEASATHREIQRGLFGSVPASPPGPVQQQGVLCAVRRFVGQPQGAQTQSFMEHDEHRSARVRRLTADVVARLPDQHVLHYGVEWRGEQGPAFARDALADQYLGLIRPQIEAVIAARKVVRTAVQAHGRDEIALANAAFEAQRAEQVEGREAELTRLAVYLAGEQGADTPLVVTGVAGSGKSTLLAEAVQRVALAHPDAVMIARYIGATPGTSSLTELLEGLRRAVASAYGRSAPVPAPNPLECSATVATELATVQVPPERPLLMVLDALDQVGADPQRTDWLPPRLAPGVRIVVSVPSERPELAALRAQVPAEQIIALGPLAPPAGGAMLRHLLQAAPRRALTPAQEAAVLAAFAAHGLPLYLRLAASEARRWRSFDPPRLGTDRLSSPTLPETTAGLLEAILERLEAPARHGREFVSNALGDLAVAGFGLGEDELLDLLARDPVVRGAVHALAPDSPPIDARLPLPVVLWARLHAEVEPLVSEREVDDVRLYTFYHQELRAAVEARYLTGAAATERHQALVHYFADQPWHLGARQWNWRKIRELMAQQEAVGDQPGAEATLDDLIGALEQAEHAQVDLQGIDAIVAAVQDHLFIAGYWGLGERLYNVALGASRALGDRPGEGVLLSNLGQLANNLGQRVKARGYLEQALALAREVGDRPSEERALNGLGLVAYNLGQMDEAHTRYTQALAIQREVGDRTTQWATLNNLGLLAYSQGQMDAARQYYEQALAIQRVLGDRRGEATTLGNLGSLAYSQGQMDAARRYHEQSLEIERVLGHRDGEAITLNNLGLLAADLGQRDAARQYYEQALAILEAIADTENAATTRANLEALSGKRHRWWLFGR